MTNVTRCSLDDYWGTLDFDTVVDFGPEVGARLVKMMSQAGYGINTQTRVLELNRQQVAEIGERGGTRVSGRMVLATAELLTVDPLTILGVTISGGGKARKGQEKRTRAVTGETLSRRSIQELNAGVVYIVRDILGSEWVIGNLGELDLDAIVKADEPASGRLIWKLVKAVDELHPNERHNPTINMVRKYLPAKTPQPASAEKPTVKAPARAARASRRSDVQGVPVAMHGQRILLLHQACGRQADFRQQQLLGNPDAFIPTDWLLDMSTQLGLRVPTLLGQRHFDGTQSEVINGAVWQAPHQFFTVGDPTLGRRWTRTVTYYRSERAHFQRTHAMGPLELEAIANGERAVSIPIFTELVDRVTARLQQNALNVPPRSFRAIQELSETLPTDLRRKLDVLHRQ